MCGFIGSVALTGSAAPRVSPEIATRIRWRGPDAFGQIESRDHVLASARLAIIDLDAEANQPIASAAGEWELVFNGEIYNYKQLASSHRLSDRARRSDTWTTLELITRSGVISAQRALRGMYAFAAWEKQSRRLWLARDPYGIKPLAWTRVGDAVLFASDPRSLASWRARLAASNSLDSYSVTHFMMVGYVPGDSTVWSDIHRVEPGEVVAIDAAGTEAHNWDPFAAASAEPRATQDQIARAIEDSVARHLVADVEVGSFLSGGVDSALITSIAQHQLDRSIRTYSVGFDSDEVPDESLLAQRIAHALRTSHTNLRLHATDFCELAESVADAFPEPHADPAAMPMLALSRRASQDVKVVLTGEGGDEMFGGYRRYWSLPLSQSGVGRLAAVLGLAAVARRTGSRRLRQVADSAESSSGEAFVRHLTQQHWKDLASTSPHCSPESVSRVFARYELRDAGVTAGSMRRLELRRHLPETYLEKDDRTTMRHGVESRVPFLDLELGLLAHSLDHNELVRVGRTKIMLRRIAARYLPAEVVRGPKRGFAVPLRDWLSRHETLKWTRQSLLGGVAVERQILDKTRLEAIMASRYKLTTSESAETLYRLLALELWGRQAAKDGAI